MLLGGGDFVQSFFVPNLWSPEDLDEILGGNGLIVLNRTGVDISSRLHELPLLTKHLVWDSAAVSSPAHFHIQDNIHLVDDMANPNECSSTKIRAAIRRGDSIRYLVHDDVLAYMQRTRLYQPGTSGSTDSSNDPPPTATGGSKPDSYTIGGIAHHIPKM
ncbi:unnamed protein product [Sphagnum balticum]